MKRVLSIAFIIGIAVSCHEGSQEPEPTDFGYLSMNISVTITEEAATGRIAAVPTDDWKVTIFSASDDSEVMVFDPYSTAPTEVQLPTGEYYIEAHSNNFAEAEFENPYYFGRSASFTIDKEELKTIDIDAELANSKVAINYSPNVINTFNEYTSTVTVVSSGAFLFYDQGETREGYFVAEPLSVVVDLSYTKLDGTFITRQFTASIDALPKTLYNINVDASLEDGKIVININVDEGFNEVDIDLGEESGILFLDDNGITIRAYPIAEVGDTDVINGITYTVVSQQQLRDMVSNGEDVTAICTSLVTNLDLLFRDNASFNQDISSWDVSNVTRMVGIFWNATSFNQDLNSWNVSNITSMEHVFLNATSFNQDLSSWDVSNVFNMIYMFYGASSFNQDLSNWDVSNVQTMANMFRNNSSFNQDIGSWNVSNVTNMTNMFLNATSFNQDLSSWDVSNMIFCSNFRNSGNWPIPNFTNCTP